MLVRAKMLLFLVQNFLSLMVGIFVFESSSFYTVIEKFSTGIEVERCVE